MRAQLTENVMNAIRDYGHHRIYSWVQRDVDKISLDRWPNGSKCTKLHPLLMRHAEKYLKEQGLSVTVTLCSYDHSPSCIDVSM